MADKGYADRHWRYRNRTSGYEFTNRLRLEVEIEGSPMVGDLETTDGHEQLAAYAHSAERRMARAWAANAIPVAWYVSSDEGQFSAAPWTETYGGPSFLEEFTWPVDAETGEPLDFFRLPVVMDRFPGWAKALRWTPAAFTPVMPLRSRMASLRGVPVLAQIDVPKELDDEPDPEPEPDAWYELLIDRDDPKSDIWFTDVADALAEVGAELGRGADRSRVRLSWEVAGGETGVIAEGEALAAWAEAFER